MSVENLAKLIESIAKLIEAMVWPVIFLWIVLRYRSEIAEFFHSLSEGSFEAFGMKASAKKMNAVTAIATAQLMRDDSKILSTAPSTDSVARRISSSLNSAGNLVTAQVFRSFKGKRVLWIDDHAMNNILETQALEALGLSVDTAPNTAAGLTKIRTRKKYNLIISDMSRDGNHQAGYEIIREIRKIDLNIPVIIYAGSSNAEEQNDAQENGAFGRVSEPEHLVELVKLALQS